MNSTHVRHLKGAPAAATLLSGVAVVSLGIKLIHASLALAQGWAFLVIAGAFCVTSGALVASLPWRLRTTLDDRGIGLGWAMGRRQIPWSQVRRVVIGPLGSGGERDPVALTLLLKSGEEVLYASLGRRRAEEHPAGKPLIDAAREKGIRVEDTMAPAEERKERAQKWREARIKGLR